ncbi:hypothetical protein COLO4_06297 [Corchorus olitorius]|uniref:Uncharacterized protein n=1 Tax=Corchorus olitorius TaxID=93759 RepID=A0A1R3KNG1_9ROSI|nr:hypothetical protein COLO4_06297 [Corchorus olitorius]
MAPNVKTATLAGILKVVPFSPPPKSQGNKRPHACHAPPLSF